MLRLGEERFYLFRGFHQPLNTCWSNSYPWKYIVWRCSNSCVSDSHTLKPKLVFFFLTQNIIPTSNGALWIKKLQRSSQPGVCIWLVTAAAMVRTCVHTHKSVWRGKRAHNWVLLIQCVSFSNLEQDLHRRYPPQSQICGLLRHKSSGSLLLNRTQWD